MSEKIASMVVEINAKVDGIKKGLQDTRGDIQRSERTLKSFQAVNINAWMQIGRSASQAAQQVYRFAESGAQLARLEQAGVALARTHGASMDQIMRATKAATGGMVSEMDLMAAANKSMMLGVTADADQMADLFAAAGARARAMGITTTQAVNDIVTGIGRMSPMILDNLGIVTGGKKVFDEYAKSIGKSTDELTDAEKKQVLLNKVLDESADLLDENGELIGDTATAYERLGAAATDAGNRLKMEFGESIRPIVGTLADLFQESNQINAAMDTLGYTFAGNGRIVDAFGNIVTVTTDEIIAMADAAQEAMPPEGVVGVGRWISDMEVVAEVTEDAAEATRGIFDIDTSLLPGIDKAREQIILMAVGWQDVERYVNDTKTAVDNGNISLDQANHHLEMAQIQALRLQQEAGLITFDEAAESLRTSLGHELSAAYMTYLNLSQPFNITSHHTIVTHHVTTGVGGPGQGNWSSGTGTTDAYTEAQKKAAAAARARTNARLRAEGLGKYATGRASGGPVGPLTLVGEQGPELIINGVVIPADTTRQLMSLGLTPDQGAAMGIDLDPGNVYNPYVPSQTVSKPSIPKKTPVSVRKPSVSKKTPSKGDNAISTKTLVPGTSSDVVMEAAIAASSSTAAKAAADTTQAAQSAALTVIAPAINQQSARLSQAQERTLQQSVQQYAVLEEIRDLLSRQAVDISDAVADSLAAAGVT